jgi:hypothetical protein
VVEREPRAPRAGVRIPPYCGSVRRLVRLFVTVNRNAMSLTHLRGTIPLLGVACGFFLAPHEASEAFYSAAAQIIPVLLLVLAVELRFFRFEAAAFRVRPPPRSQSLIESFEATAESAELAKAGRTVYAAITLVVLTVGEFAALHPLAQGSATAGNPQWVYAALAGGFVAIATLAVIGEPATKKDD